MVDLVRSSKVIAVIRAVGPETALRSAQACIEGGLKLIEITFSFSGADKVISELSKGYDVVVGAGTVLNMDMARAAAAAGANFIVSPHTDRELIHYAKSRDLLVVAGALTSSEIVNAWRLGADMVKIFPVKAVGGASYIRAIKEPLPFVEVMTTGGVTLENFKEFLDAGATAVGLSSALLGKNGSFEPEIIYERAKRVTQEIN
ncbi:MAG TPA: bifunctional 4-hydroxy-2-oxoglutarate aldolase/2-dehydro-3-deoxy-phosphogluconate aldolase [Thermodesulfobacteriota bacterium]|nr:bifunctional 4-hydroxy-2-oxoglutarate aldolase/2-dehydro-3-deoxy-phosphogluconate aldolase [Thermodesulfobacteriota bacterium]